MGFIQSILENMVDIVYAPTIIELEKADVRQKAEAEEKKKMEEEKAKKEGRAEEKKSDKIKSKLNDILPEEASKDLKAAIDKLGLSSFTKADLKDKAAVTNTYIKYVELYVKEKGTNPIEAGKDYSIDADEKKMINAIAERKHGFKIFPTYVSMDLNSCDPTKDTFNREGRFVLLISELGEKKSATKKEDKKQGEKKSAEKKDDKAKNEERKPIIVVQKEEKKQEKEEELEEVVVEVVEAADDKDDNQKVHPIEFTIRGEEKIVKVDDNFSKILDERMKPFLDGRQHRWTEAIETGLFNLHIRNGEVEDLIKVDPFGCIMGGYKPYIMARIPNDCIMVSLDSDKDLVNAILSNPFKLLTPEEIAKCETKFFHNANIYRYVDMSNTGFMDNLTSEGIDKLSNNITTIIMCQPDGQELPRMRFDSFASPDEFVLVSDKKCISPLSGTGETVYEIKEGLKYIFSKETITKMMGENEELQIMINNAA